MKRAAIPGLLFFLGLAAFAQYNQKTRSVHGKVVYPDGEPVAGAVVLIENTKTLQVRSYVTQAEGTFAFHGLSTEVDYELRARRRGITSSAVTLSQFNSKPDPEITIKFPAGKG